MKAQHAILRFAKYKGPTISRIEAHNERTMDAIPPEIIAIYNAESERKETVHREEK